MRHRRDRYFELGSSPSGVERSLCRFLVVAWSFLQRVQAEINSLGCPDVICDSCVHSDDLSEQCNQKKLYQTGSGHVTTGAPSFCLLFFNTARFSLSPARPSRRAHRAVDQAPKDGLIDGVNGRPLAAGLLLASAIPDPGWPRNQHLSRLDRNDPMKLFRNVL